MRNLMNVSKCSPPKSSASKSPLPILDTLYFILSPECCILWLMHKHAISFKNAFNGIWVAITTQANIRIHFVVASLVLIAAASLQVSIFEILVLILTITIVMLAEMINTSLEFLSDAVTIDHNPLIKNAKDVSAGAVLISAIFAFLVGLIIFIPKIIALWTHFSASFSLALLLMQL